MKKIFFILNICLPLSLVAQNLELTSFLDSLNQTYKISILVQTSSGESLLSQQADSVVPSASVIKVPILLELFNQVQQKKIKLSKKHTLQESDKAGGEGEVQKIKIGKKLTIKYLAREMIRTSDNTATNILIQHLGMENINQFLRNQQCPKTMLQRKMMDFEAIKYGRQNYINAQESNRLLLQVLNQTILTPKLCRQVLQILEICDDHTTIPRYLPSSLRIAHKTGSLDYVRGDAAIVFSPKPLVISIFVEKFKEIEQAEEIIAKLAALIVYQYGNLNNQ
ncbi:MAG: class A beta-lactamase-related serine hydrolase [Microscillaceae bacterium]|jgi:beta-lactamase class A|nr:class A beta-lactamase-related serine hydrolase [Microscillaceae bacterium]